MFLMQKWDFKTRKYEPFISPAKILMLHQENMAADVDCANCGKRMLYGNSLTSRTIHTEMGLGYPVCDDCYAVEIKDEAENRHE